MVVLNCDTGGDGVLRALMQLTIGNDSLEVVTNWIEKHPCDDG